MIIKKPIKNEMPISVQKLMLLFFSWFNFFYQAFGLMIICFLAVIAFYAFGFALIIITEFIKSLSEKNDK